jgi:hypothetical protein
MKRREIFRCAIFLSVLMATLMLPSTGSSMSSPYWSGTDAFSPLITQEKAIALHDYLLNEVDLPALQFPLLVAKNNPDNQYGVIINDKKRTYDGYTMLCVFQATKMIDGNPVNAVLIDMQGNVVNTWSFNPSGHCGPIKLLPNGHVMGATTPVAHFGHITEQDWDGNIIWEDTDVMMHHDHQIYNTPVYYTPSAEDDQNHKSKKFKVLVLSQDFPNITETSHISDFPLVDDSYVEVDRDGNELWRWNAWEHFEQFGFDDAAKQAIRTVKITELPPGEHPEGTDWTHCNSASYLGPNKWYEKGDERFHPDNILFNSRSMNILGIIARHDDHKGKWKSGDIVYRIGPDYSMGQPGYKLGQIIGAHMAHMIPEGLPGAGNILLFNNGGYAGFGELVPGSGIGVWPNRYSDVSRVIEFNPVTQEIVWEYNQIKPTADANGDGVVQGNERKFLSIVMSAAQRLPNGNTLITEATTGRVFEVTKDNDVVWEYISPFTDAHPLLGSSNYRAYRVPKSWVPLKHHKCR